MNNELLLEIGTEEIPAGFLNKALKDMESIIGKLLSENRIAYKDIKCLATPRRLVLYIADVARKQNDQTIEKTGPARKAAFDEKGKPTNAALGFAKGQGLDVSALEIIITEKGEYIGARKTVYGRPTAELLPAILNNFILSIPFKKSMRWSSFDLRFARPLHWLLAIYGGDVIPLQIENITSGNLSCGHRFMSPESFPVASFEDYLVKTRGNYVIASPGERRNMILTEAQKAAAEIGGKLFFTEDLMDTVTFIVEYPVIVRGSFDKDYLKIPKEVLTTTMMSHQKYFPITDTEGNLLPYFVTVSNTEPRDRNIVARGNERVLHARLADASFFFEEDKKVPLENRVEALKKVIFHTLLGTSYDKVQRFRKLAAYITEKINPELKKDVDRAAFLAKADLESQMVGEFPELQGIMGSQYALLAGEKANVAKAVYEHYLPITAGGNLPQTHEGAIVGIADKMDTIVGFFGVGLQPTGAADPYALRRQALGIINIILYRQYNTLLIGKLIDESLSLFENKLNKSAGEIKKDVMEFFRGRLENQMIAQGYPYDTVEAVLSTGFSNIVITAKKIKALQAFRQNPEFGPVSTAFKRVENILKDFCNPQLNVKYFSTDAEKKLFSAFEKTKTEVEKAISAADFGKALALLAELRPPVDYFFDNVMVMDKDKRTQKNRLSLLAEISALFHKLTDFSKIVISG
ncbi:MAG TPA: glycine--tRNA ligase subunit beta [Deltaproteobacteria bacterium]|nr:glycine--tRNA ligase subunit beta [Deltaproteobacteria bacterium]